MKIEKVDINTLLFDPSNFNEHGDKNISSLKSSLAKFGQQKIIVVDGDNIVIAGNGTLEAAKAIGWSSIYIHRTELTGPEAIAYAIADNQIARTSNWNLETLGSHLQGLREDGWELEDLGFELDDLSAFENLAEPTGIAPDGATELNEDDFNEFEHTCPKCSFQFDGKKK